MNPVIQEQLMELEGMSREQLAARWLACFGVPAPALTRSTLLRQAVAWHLQTKEYGGLSVIEKRQIQSGIAKPILQATQGARLVRVWQGKTHQVTVLENEYLYENQTYKSLSAIAKQITGTPWSGPVFFGLKKPSKSGK